MKKKPGPTTRQRKDLPPFLHCCHCGSIHISVMRNTNGWQFAMCGKCQSTGPVARTSRGAISKWNSRKYLHYA